MNNLTTSRVNMIRTVLNYCTNNAADTAGIPAFAGVKTSADNKLVLIDQLDQIVMPGTEGVTLNTKLLRETMSNIALKCAGAVCAYGGTINDHDLINATNFTLPGLNRLKKEEVANACQTIHDVANTNIANAGAYGYVAADVTDLQTAINLYRASMQNPRDRKVDISQAIENINQLVRELIDDLLKIKIDKMVTTLKATNPDFVGGYFGRREIVNIGSTTAKIRGTVKDRDDVPIVGVIFSIYQTGTTVLVAETSTVLKGKFGISHIPAGDYDLKWTFQGYQTVTETNVHISPGKELQRKITMKKGGVSATLAADLAAGAIANVPVTNLNVTEESTMRLTVTGSTLRFYASASNTAAPGAQYFDVAPGQSMTKSVVEWSTVFGFDEEIEDFLNVQNVGAVAGHYEMKFENLEA